MARLCAGFLKMFSRSSGLCRRLLKDARVFGGWSLVPEFPFLGASPRLRIAVKSCGQDRPAIPRSASQDLAQGNAPDRSNAVAVRAVVQRRFREEIGLRP